MEEIKTLKRQLAAGVTPAMVTPVSEGNFAVNLAVVPQLVDFLHQKGVSGLFVGGTTGEGICFSADERRALLEATVAAAGNLPVLAHAGGITTAATLDLARHAANAGAAGIVVVTPWYFGMDDAALLDYFQEVAAVVSDTPILVYDIPQAAVNGVSPALLDRLQSTIPNFAGLKCSRTDMQIIRALLTVIRDDLIFLAGNEAIALGSLAMGASGMISGLSTAIPEPFVALTAAAGRGDLESARRAQTMIQRLLDQLPAGRRLGAIKQILQARGVPVGSTVPPRLMPQIEGGGLWERLQPDLIGLEAG